jgi:hypothetical protein
MWNDFWFRPIDARQYAALRILFGGLSAIYFFGLLPYVETQFSGLGWLADIQQITSQNGGSWSLFFIPTRSYAILLAYSIVIVGVLAAFLLMLGWQSRLMAGLTWLVWVSLWNRNPLLLDGDDAVLKIMAFYLLLSPCGHYWSLDAHLNKQLNKKPQQVTAWPLRLIQFQIALIYFVSGWVKFHSTEWQDGTVMQYVLIHPQYSRWDGWVIVGNPFMAGLLAALAGFIRWWELLFPFLLINANTRKLSILIGILFHLGLLLIMNLRWFAIIMLALYPALLANNWFPVLEQKLPKFLRIYRANPQV